LGFYYSEELATYFSQRAQQPRLPTGQRTGNTITSWMSALQMANVFGMPYRIFVCALGLLVAPLSNPSVYRITRARPLFE
jgi:uncharacterized iron-regulated membrane protein